MKIKDFDSAPFIVKQIYVAAKLKQPIGASTYEEALRDYPEYFPDEIAYKKRWVSIPESVHEAYRRDVEALRSNRPSKFDEVSWRTSLEHSELNKEYDKYLEYEGLEQEKIGAKHYGKYNVRYFYKNYATELAKRKKREAEQRIVLDKILSIIKDFTTKSKTAE